MVMRTLKAGTQLFPLSDDDGNASIICRIRDSITVDGDPIDGPDDLFYMLEAMDASTGEWKEVNAVVDDSCDAGARDVHLVHRSDAKGAFSTIASGVVSSTDMYELGVLFEDIQAMNTTINTLWDAIVSVHGMCDHPWDIGDMPKLKAIHTDDEPDILDDIDELVLITYDALRTGQHIPTHPIATPIKAYGTYDELPFVPVSYNRNTDRVILQQSADKFFQGDILAVEPNEDEDIDDRIETLMKLASMLRDEMRSVQYHVDRLLLA